MRQGRQKVKDFEFIGGNLSLDFANTVDGLRGRDAQESLTDYAALVDWALHAGIISVLQAGQLNQFSLEHISETKKVYERAIALREAIYHIFSAVASQIKPSEGDLDLLNDELATALGKQELKPFQDRYRLTWITKPPSLDFMVWPVAQSAATLLTSADLNRVRECASDNCEFLFIDLTKNHSRRWCDMKGCGNRAKIRRFRKKNFQV